MKKIQSKSPKPEMLTDISQFTRGNPDDSFWKKYFIMQLSMAPNTGSKSILKGTGVVFPIQRYARGGSCRLNGSRLQMN